jgi:DNA-directed RNA polymerase specialized sigma subunit
MNTLLLQKLTTYLEKSAQVLPLEPTTPAHGTSEYYNSLKDKDQELYDQWSTTKSKKHLGLLMDSLGKLVYTEVRRQSGTLPPAALSAEAKKWAIKAIETYDPEKGAGISTHVVNYLQKVRRMNYKFQNAARLPENEQLNFNDYNHALAMLTEELNREPTVAELAKKLGWSAPRTVRFKERLYSDLVESSSERPQEYSRFNEGAILMEHLMGQLDYQEKFILENSKVMNATELAKNLGVNVNRLNYLKSKLIAKISSIRQESGVY